MELKCNQFYVRIVDEVAKLINRNQGDFDKDM